MPIFCLSWLGLSLTLLAVAAGLLVFEFKWVRSPQSSFASDVFTTFLQCSNCEECFQNIWTVWFKNFLNQCFPVTLSRRLQPRRHKQNYFRWKCINSHYYGYKLDIEAKVKFGWITDFFFLKYRLKWILLKNLWKWYHVNMKTCWISLFDSY